MTNPDLSTVTLDLEDAQAIATNIAEHLQYDDDTSSAFWEPILNRLRASIAQADSLI